MGLPVLKNQCLLSSCFPSVMRKKIQISTHPVKKNELQSHQVFSEKNMNTNFSRTKSSVRVQERHCKKFFNKKNLKKNIYNILRIKILFLEPKLFFDPTKLFILFFNIFFVNIILVGPQNRY